MELIKGITGLFCALIAIACYCAGVTYLWSKKPNYPKAAAFFGIAIYNQNTVEAFLS